MRTPFLQVKCTNHDHTTAKGGAKGVDFKTMFKHMQSTVSALEGWRRHRCCVCWRKRIAGSQFATSVAPVSPTADICVSLPYECTSK